MELHSKDTLNLIAEFNITEDGNSGYIASILSKCRQVHCHANGQKLSFYSPVDIIHEAGYKLARNNWLNIVRCNMWHTPIKRRPWLDVKRDLNSRFLQPTYVGSVHGKAVVVDSQSAVLILTYLPPTSKHALDNIMQAHKNAQEVLSRMLPTGKSKRK